VDGWSFHAAGIGAVLLPALRPASMKRTKTGRCNSPPPSNNATTRACPFLTRLIEKRKETYNLMDVPFFPRTLNRRGYPLRSKDSLPGGWLTLPGRASHPLEYATLPGRTMDVPFFPPLPLFLPRHETFYCY
jgi:hypothetical protein